MSVARTAFARSLRQAPCSRRSVNPSLPLIRSFTKPTSAAMSAEDEEKHRAKYEKHRVEVDPKLAGIDESFQFTEPKVSFCTSVPPLMDRNGTKTPVTMSSVLDTVDTTSEPWPRSLWTAKSASSLERLEDWVT